jgi:uncharacterized membrane protein
MAMLIAAAAVFLGIHLLIAGTRVRDAITGAIGERPYLGLFSLASIGVIVWLVMAYKSVPGDENPIFYNLGEAVHHLGIPIVLLAFLLGVQGLLAPNPTTVQQEGSLNKEGTIHGVLRITRHPFLWGVAIWAAFHLAANGDLASVILFGTFLLLSILGTFSIDAKRQRKLGAAWDAFAAKTSNVPFAAVIAKRNTLNITESLGWRFWVALLIFIVVLFSHARVIGVSPFPNGYIPF